MTSSEIREACKWYAITYDHTCYYLAKQLAYHLVPGMLDSFVDLCFRLFGPKWREHTIAEVLNHPKL
jgi:hypothetical protein